MALPLSLAPLRRCVRVRENPAPTLFLSPTPTPNPTPNQASRVVNQTRRQTFEAMLASDVMRNLKRVDTAAALDSGSTTRPPLPQPWARAAQHAQTREEEAEGG